jgi:hypothetical protein
MSGTLRRAKQSDWSQFTRCRRLALLFSAESLVTCLAASGCAAVRLRRSYLRQSIYLSRRSPIPVRCRYSSPKLRIIRASSGHKVRRSNNPAGPVRFPVRNLVEPTPVTPASARNEADRSDVPYGPGPPITLIVAAKDGVNTSSLQATLGHRDIKDTARYTALAPDRCKGF